MLLFGMFGKFGAVFVSIPDPVIGGSSAALFGKGFTCIIVKTRSKNRESQNVHIRRTKSL